MKLKIKVVYLIDEQEYYCFVDGLQGVEGYGSTEEEAIEDFKINCEKSFRSDDEIL